jgi:amidophosphoribosyltransferase
MLGRRGALTVDSLPRGLDPITGQKPSESCAVVGFHGRTQAFPVIYSALRTLQHRGQENSGVATHDGQKIELLKVDGHVFEGFKPHIEKGDYPKGKIGIGHNRYSTEGLKNITGAGPYLVNTSAGQIAVAHNGEITNFRELREELKEKGVPFFTTTDTEVMVNLLAREIKERGLLTGLRNAMSILKGSYSVTMMIDDKLYAIRDPLGFKPLIIGKIWDGMMVASESSAIDVLGGSVIRDVEPGEVVEMDSEGFRTILKVPSERKAHCMFEWVYFARPDSIIDNVEVYNSRYHLGLELAREAPASGDIVIPVPDSGRTQASGFAEGSGIPYAEGLFKNRYSERTFIMPNQKERDEAVRIKLNPIRSVISGKRIVLVDDTIVRGTTTRRIVGLLRKAGAKEVHVRVASPKIIAPCYFGIDMKTRDQFIALNRNDEEIAAEIGADSVAYLSMDGLTKSIGKSKHELCLGCLTGKYPVKVKDEIEYFQKTLE